MSGSVNLSGYHLSFDAEFGTTSDLSYFINTFNSGATTLAVNGEAENYTSDSNVNTPGSNYSIQNGELTITATPNADGTYSSGAISTGYSFYQNQGYFEMRAELPSGAGFWPAFWMLSGYDTQGPVDLTPEIDILEDPNNSGPDSFFNSVKTRTYDQGGFTNTGTSLSTSYHTYGFMWTANSIQFTLDGNYIGSAIGTPPALANLKMYLFANLAVGGYWAGPPAVGATAQLKIDYIRAYSNDPSVPTWWGGVEPISSPDGVNTTPNLGGTTGTTGTTVTTATPTPATPVVVGGSGADTLALQISEDAYLGDAQFTVSVDGRQVGGTQTVTALHSAGATQEFDVLGNFTPGAHTVNVNFLNDTYGGSPTLDRNLYVNSASIDGTAIPSSSLTEAAGGPQSVSFQKASDTLTLNVSEDAYQGDAQYQVLVDGYYVGGTYTSTASHAAGQINTQTITGNWGNGPHTVGIQFINDAYGGSPSTDRNLYINSVTYDGTQVTSGTVEQAANGVANVAVPANNILMLDLAEDAYQGDAQFSISVDGKTVDQPTTVTALHSTGLSQAFNFGGLSTGTHDIGVSFLNDAYNGSPSTDRNLYVTGAQINGTSLSSSTWSAAIDTTSTQHFSLVVPS